MSHDKKYLLCEYTRSILIILFQFFKRLSRGENYFVIHG